MERAMRRTRCGGCRPGDTSAGVSVGARKLDANAEGVYRRRTGRCKQLITANAAGRYTVTDTATVNRQR